MLACSINASYLALLDAGIPMNGIVTAVSVGVFDDKIIPFPSQNEIKVSSKAVLSVSPSLS